MKFPNEVTGSLLSLLVTFSYLRPWQEKFIVSAAVVARTFTIRPRRSRPPLSPDCFIDKDMLLVDDLNPGPQIRANVGDTIQIRWINESPSEGVSIHYHGLIMQDQPYVDGTGGVTTCIVGPLQTFYTTFVANNAGTHYWHGHTSLDRMDGLQGAIIIEDPNDPEEQLLKAMYDEERVIFLQDWYHRSGPGIRTGLDSEPFIWLGDAQTFLINGKGRYGRCVDDPKDPMCDPEGCSEEEYLSSIQVEEGKTYLFRIINAASLVSVNFGIANHNMTIVRAEGTYVEPLEVTTLDVNVAQRYSVLVTADQEPDTSYWISTKVRHRGGVMGQAYLQYGNADPPKERDDTAEHIEQNDLDLGPFLDSLLVSKNVSNLPNSDILGPDVVTDRTIVFVGTQTRLADSNLLRWASNNVSNSLHSPKPLLTMAYDAVHKVDAAPWPETNIPKTIVIDDYPPEEWNHTETLQDEGVSIYHDQHGIAIYKFVLGDVVDMVLQNARALNGVPELHSWHLHGHQFYVIGQGYGTFDPEVDPMSYNLENPLLRDTVSLWPLGWTAVRFKAANVGAWAFHCAMAPHAVMGMGFNIITSPDLLEAPPPGLESCYHTSVNPADAQVCTSATDGSGGPEEVVVVTEDDFMPADPMEDDIESNTLEPMDAPDNSTKIEELAPENNSTISEEEPTEPPTEEIVPENSTITEEPTEPPTEELVPENSTMIEEPTDDLPVLELIEAEPMDETEPAPDELAVAADEQPVQETIEAQSNNTLSSENMTIADDEAVVGGNNANQTIVDEGLEDTSSARVLTIQPLIGVAGCAYMCYILL